MGVPGPVELGRSVVVGPDAPTPEGWAGADRVVVDDAAVAAPAPVAARLHAAWAARRPLVIELSCDPGALRAPERLDGPVWAVAPDHTFWREQLQFLVWANSYDARSAETVWWHGRRAARLHRERGVTEGGPADVVLADGTPLWVDGGPSQPPELAGDVGVAHRFDTEAGRIGPRGHGAPAAELAPDQLAAVTHRSGPARVIAPAGSGKTRVLTERLRHLVGDRRVHPGTVTALAFNTKAADELRARCAGVVGADGPHIRTLNSIGLWICTRFGPAGRYRVLEEPAARDLVQQVFGVRRQANTDTVVPYLDALSAVRLGLRSPDEVEDEIPDAAGLGERFDAYRGALADAGAVDFDEQIYLALELLVADPDARAAARHGCRHLLVDEFQDLTPAHVLLIRLLAAPGFDCFGVGDDDQVIYEYAGASPTFLIDYPRYFPGAGHHALEVNYRCPPAVVAGAATLLAHNRHRLAKAIRSAPGRHDEPPAATGPLAGAGPRAVTVSPADEMPGRAVEVVAAWLAAGVAPDDVAVLARVNSSLLPVQVACLEAGVPCTRPLDAAVLGRTGIRTALAYLRIGAAPDQIRREDVAETVRRPSRGIAPKVVDMLLERPVTSLAALRGLAGRLTGRDGPKVAEYAEDLDTVARACRRSTAAALRAVRVQVGLGDTMEVLDSSRREADRSTHADDLAALEALAGHQPDPAAFEGWLRDLLRRRPDDAPAVTLSTVHRMKGREWGHVAVYGASAGLFPHRRAADWEAERRVFHVAVTRARRQLVVLADAAAPSPFVAELSEPPVPGAPDPGPADRPERAAGRRTAGRPRPPAGRGAPALAPVVASVGLTVGHGGHTGTVVELDGEQAVLAVGSARLGVRYGAEVDVDGRRVVLTAPDGPAAAQAAVVAGVERALRAWRAEAARRTSVPAYVVLNDRELTGIAVARPATLAELAGCRGMGEIRLERWGDEILAVVAGVGD